ncbi:MAG: DEAD/DEAH box helicase [Bacteroidetes bacterium]|nr:DEAD/DEAH box helicase [Bacteroidota bacterium]
MQISEKANIGFVYSVVSNQYLGLIIEPFLVEKMQNGKFSLTNQKLIFANAGLYKNILNENDFQAIKILDEISAENITKKFYRKEKLRPKEFFEKKCDDKLYQSTIRPFIERKLNEALNFIDKENIYLSSDSKNPTYKKLNVFTNNINVLFHFIRNETETRYYITIKLNDERLKLNGNGLLLTCEPANIIVGNNLLTIENIDGRKIEPFFSKYYISVNRRSEEIFFKKFGLDIIEKFNVKSDGFEIIQEKQKASAILKLEKILNNKYGFILSFCYDGHIFPYHSKKIAHVIYEKQGENFIFKKYKRSRDWEEHKRQFIESLGLIQFEGSVFVLNKNYFEDTLEDETLQKYVVLNWLEKNIKNLEGRDFEIIQNIGKNNFFLGQKNLKIEISDHRDWFDISTKVWFGDFEIPFIKLRKNIIDNNREYILPNGEIALIPEEWMSKFKTIFNFDEGNDSIKIKKLHWGLLGTFETTENIQTKLEGLRQYTEIEEKPLPAGFKGELRNYQKAGFNWFYFLKKFGFGGCLADDMGLGKTIQTLALLQNEKEENKVISGDENNIITNNQLNLFSNKNAENSRKTSLLIVPTSLIYNWKNEAKKFTPTLKTYEHIGQSRLKNNKSFANYDLVISTYGTLRNDEELFKNFNFHYIILDESQNIKNPYSMISKTVRNLHSNYKLVLTGTPVENSVRDLWSQLSFTNPGLLGGLKFFEENYVNPIEKDNNQEKLDELKTIVKPFILRRTKLQVAKELPEKTEQILYCDMTPEQEKIYEETKSKFRNQILQNIENNGLNKEKMNVIVGLTKLRQIANHPLLTDNTYNGNSGKFIEMLDRTHTAIESGHKILIYSQFVEQLKIIRKAFDAEGLNYCYFDGSYSAAQRQSQVKIFQESSNISIFLVSLKAGGTGLTLTAADYVFIVDPWWNPSVELQAIDRTHRIGQTKKIFSYKFISKNTVEEKILNLQNKKLHLASDLILAEESFYKKLEIEDIKNILE